MGRGSDKLDGLQFTRLKVIGWVKSKGWLCICDCGNTRHVSTEHLEKGRVKSCGCLRKEKQVYKKLGMTRSSTLSSYLSMLQRTNNLTYDATQDDRYTPYLCDERKVCDRWLEPNGVGFENFLNDLGQRPEGTTIERIDNTKGYSLDNCKWDTHGNQCYNRKIFSNNSTGRTGVYLRKETGKWRAKINVKGETINIGDFLTFEAACAARESAEIKYYGFKKE